MTAFAQALDVLASAPVDPALVSARGGALLQRWAQSHRGYHNLVHLDEVLAALAQVSEGAPTGELALAQLAAFYHDAVYEPGRPDNEAASAHLARADLAYLGVAGEAVEAVAGLVLETLEHLLPPPDSASAWLHDADLWILSAPSARFEEYCAQVRQEYAAVPAPVYARERARILLALRDRPVLYATPVARRTWDAAARRNLDRELARLTG